MVEDRHPGCLVSTAWLAAHLSDPDLRVFECTTYLRPAEPGADVPYHPEAGRADYERGHIPGAGFLDLPGELSRREEFAAVMARHGVGEGTRVVLYSRDRIMWATRVWWMLRVMGFDDAAVLDGGFEKWQAEGRPVSADPAVYAAATFIASPRPELMVDKDAVLAALEDPGTRLINTLSEADFAGEEPSRYGRPGRIPGSASLPWPGMTEPDGDVFIGLEDAAARLAALGAPEAERIVCYCGGGISATMGLFLLHRLGYANLALYDASMAEWARDESLPIERGPPRG
jgi:thiosulfate/3-mercaptopyruvate sulfurtransferase